MRFYGNWTTAFSLPNVSLHFSSVWQKSHFRQIWPRNQGSLSSTQSGLLYLAGRGKLPEFSIPSNSKPKRLNLNSWWVWLGDLGFPSSPQPLPTHSWLYPRSHSPRILRLQPPLPHLTHKFRPGKASWSSTWVQQPKQWLILPRVWRGSIRKISKALPKGMGLIWKVFRKDKA